MLHHWSFSFSTFCEIKIWGGGCIIPRLPPLFWCGYSNITIHIILAGGYQTAPWNCRRPVPALMTVGQPALMASFFKCWSSELTHRPLMWGHWPRLLLKCKHVSLNYPKMTLSFEFLYTTSTFDIFAWSRSHGINVWINWLGMLSFNYNTDVHIHKFRQEV